MILSASKAFFPHVLLSSSTKPAANRDIKIFIRFYKYSMSDYTAFNNNFPPCSNSTLCLVPAETLPQFMINRWFFLFFLFLSSLFPFLLEYFSLWFWVFFILSLEKKKYLQSFYRRQWRTVWRTGVKNLKRPQLLAMEHHRAESETDPDSNLLMFKLFYHMIPI